MNWEAKAPSNIALIKYMGKANKKSIDSNQWPNTNLFKLLQKNHKEDLYFQNLSLNPSLSYTLNHFITKVRIEESNQEAWSVFKKNPFQDEKLYNSSKKINIETRISDQAQKKFLDFFQFLKKVFSISGNYTIYSQNNFPMSAGSASSASSFSALTLAVYKLAKQQSDLKELTTQDLAHLSRIGSGSSCRSFFSPFCLWTDQRVEVFKNSWKSFFHQLVIVDLQAKKISSTQAHQMVRTSPHFKMRAERAEKRLQSLSEALNQKSWQKCFTICYEEFLDLHSLFETAKTPFKYKTNLSEKVLSCVNDYWKKNKDGPLMTMDAGANVHLLYRLDQKDQSEKIKNLLSDFIVLSSL